MQSRYFFLFVAFVSSFLTGCGSSEENNVQIANLTVQGPEEGVKRFANLQSSRSPKLPVSVIKELGEGRAEAVVTFPSAYNEEDLVQTTREVLAAGLSYDLTIVE